MSAGPPATEGSATARPYVTNLGRPAYDAARWLAPPPAVRNLRSLPLGAHCLVQQGGSSRSGATQEAIVRDRGEESLLIFPDGTGAFDLYDQSRKCQPNATVGMALMGADTAARWVARPNRSRMIQVHFPIGLRAVISEAASPVPFDGAYLAVPGDGKAVFAAFCADCDREESPQLLIETYISLIIQKLQFDPPTPLRGGLATWQLRRVTERLREDLHRPCGLAELAREVGLSSFHLVRMFKRSTGLPPHQFLIRLRCEQACFLLETTDLPVTDVAARVGYDDPGYLARVFRKAYGRTPLAHRRAYRR